MFGKTSFYCPQNVTNKMKYKPQRVNFYKKKEESPFAIS